MERGAMVLTTNYDNLLEIFGQQQSKPMESLDLKDKTKVLQWARGHIRYGVLHIHGLYTDPCGMVLDPSGYKDVTQDPEVMEVLQNLYRTKSFLFVGCLHAAVANPICIFNMVMANVTTTCGFLLMGFSNTRELQILPALLFLLMYLSALAGNVIIIAVTTLDQHLQSPMYYFLKHLSFLDLAFISVTVPQSIDTSLTGNGCISHGQCMLQVFFFTSLAWAEVAILTVMSYDRYAAICLPLHYEAIMDPRACEWAVIAVWLSGGTSGILYTAATFSITFCRAKVIHQFFCDIPQLLKLSCSNDYLGVIGVAAFMTVLAFICFISIAHSYIHIFSTVLRIPSAEGRSKAFSTCLPHLFVVSFFLSIGIFEFLKSTSDSPTAFDIMISLFYTVVPPTLNPIIYSLRNKTMREALRKLLLDGEFTKKKTFLSYC